MPGMICPLLATSMASLFGAPTRSWAPMRNAAQWLIGSALGLYFTPQVTALVASLWWAILLAVAWALALGHGFGRWLHARHAQRISPEPRVQWATSYFAGAIGGASEMTLLAEREQGRSDLVAAAHTMRLVIVTLVIPFALQYSGLQGLDASLPGARSVQPLGLGLLAVATAAGGWLMARTGRANPWFMGALFASMGVTMAGLEWSAMPRELTNAAQLVIGGSLMDVWLMLLFGVIGYVFRAPAWPVLPGHCPGRPGCTRPRWCSEPRPAASPRWPSRPRCCSWGCRW